MLQIDGYAGYGQLAEIGRPEGEITRACTAAVGPTA